MLSGLKISFKNANTQEQPKAETIDQITGLQAALNPPVIAQSVPEPPAAESKIQKRKYDFSKPQEEEPSAIEKEKQLAKPTNPQSGQKEIESIEGLRTEVNVIWKMIENRELQSAGSRV